MKPKRLQCSNMEALTTDTKRTTPQTSTIGTYGKMVFCDNLDPQYGLQAIKDKSINLVFTSPPYWNYQDYGNNGTGTEETYQHYIASVGSVLQKLYAKFANGGRLVINASNMKSRRKIEGKAFIYPIIADLIREAHTAGYTYFDEIIWLKGEANAGALGGKPLFGSYPYPATPKILDSIFENILVFTKDGKRPAVTPEIKEKSKLTKDQWAKFTKGVWQIPHDRDPVHPATFPMGLAERVIRIYSFQHDLVVDPYAGTGTTVIAAERLSRVGIGYEIGEQFRPGTEQKTAHWLRQAVNPDCEYAGKGQPSRQ